MLQKVFFIRSTFSQPLMLAYLLTRQRGQDFSGGLYLPCHRDHYRINAAFRSADDAIDPRDAPLIISTLLYRSETWPVTVTNMKRFEAAHHKRPARHCNSRASRTTSCTISLQQIQVMKFEHV